MKQPTEVGYFACSAPRGEKAVTANGIFVDDRQMIYIIDRFARGLDIGEYTAPL